MMYSQLYKKLLCLIMIVGSTLYASTSLYNPNSVRASNHVNKQEMLSFLRNLIKEGSLVFDVGANVGNKTEFYLACGAHVVCFEPQEECITTLHKRFDANARVTIHKVGLGCQEGFLELWQCADASTISSFSKEWVEKGRFAVRGTTWNKKVTVPITTLDAMIARYGKPHFCKIDVENFEYEVLKGLTHPIKYMSFECNSENMNITKQCIEYLVKLGYKNFNFSLAERGCFVFNYWLPADHFIQELEKMARENYGQCEWGLWGDVYVFYDDVSS